MRIGRMSEKTDAVSEYETHVTVRCPAPAEPARLEAGPGGGG